MIMLTPRRRKVSGALRYELPRRESFPIGGHTSIELRAPGSGDEWFSPRFSETKKTKKNGVVARWIAACRVYPVFDLGWVVEHIDLICYDWSVRRVSTMCY